MGLASALSTALTGLTAAETTIDVVGNNLANSSTVGFKASQAQFATQFLQTQSLGSVPVGNSGGTNPRQVGLGVQVASITPDFTQGTIQLSSILPIWRFKAMVFSSFRPRQAKVFIPVTVRSK